MPAARRRLPARRAAVVAGGLLLAGCATGTRPHVGEAAPAPTTTVANGPVGDAGVDRVLSLLESSAPNELTARYKVTRKLGNNSADAVVVRDGPKTAVTVGDVRYLTGDRTRTCSLSAATCQDGLHEQVTFGQYSVRESFYGGQPATALRVAYGRKSGPAKPGTVTVAGIQTECVDIPVGTGVERYCAAPAGVLAVWDTAYVHVELVGLQDTPDQTALAAPA